MRIISQDGKHNADMKGKDVRQYGYSSEQGDCLIEMKGANESYQDWQKIGIYSTEERATEVMSKINNLSTIPEQIVLERGLMRGSPQVEGIVDRPIVYQLPEK